MLCYAHSELSVSEAYADNGSASMGRFEGLLCCISVASTVRAGPYLQNDSDLR